MRSANEKTPGPVGRAGQGGNYQLTRAGLGSAGVGLGYTNIVARNVGARQGQLIPRLLPLSTPTGGNPWPWEKNHFFATNKSSISLSLNSFLPCLPSITSTSPLGVTQTT